MKAVYIRISTANQNIERQLKKDKSIVPFIDVCSGSVRFHKRKEGKRLMSNKKVKEIHVKHVDRLGRNLGDILNTIEHFTNKGVNIHIEALGLNTLVDGKTTPMAKMVISMFGAVAELEKENIKERTREGIAAAKEHDRNVKSQDQKKYKGRKRGAVSNLAEKNQMEIAWLQSKLNDGLNISEISRQSKEITPKGFSRPRIYSYLNRGLLKKPITVNKTSFEKSLEDYAQREKERIEKLRG